MLTIPTVIVGLFVLTACGGLHKKNDQVNVEKIMT
jgi:hypothetical protein